MYKRLLSIYLVVLSLLIAGCGSDSSNANSQPIDTPPAASDNADLSDLSVSQGSLDPDFISSQASYELTVDQAVTTLRVTPVAADAEASLTVQGESLSSGSASQPIDLVVGTNQIEIMVTAEDGSTQTYTVTVTRAPSNDATLAALNLSTGNLNEPFEPETTNYSAEVDTSSDTLTITATPNNTGATLTIDDVATASGEASAPIALSEGENLISVVVTAQDDNTTQTYFLTVTRAAAQTAMASVPLLVLDSQGVLVNNADITLDGSDQQASTGEDGRASITVPEQSRQIIRISKPGYIAQALPVELPENAAPAPFTVALIARNDAVQIASTENGGTANGIDGAGVTLPAGALVDAAGQPITGAVDVFITPVNVSDDRAFRAFPGGFEARNQEDEPGFMLTLGTVDFSFEQNGEQLSLAAGQTAEIEMPLYITRDEQGNELSVGQTLPFWFLDEEQSLWVEDGQGVVVASASSPTGLAIRGQVTHFSWWNVDIFTVRAEMEVRVRCDNFSCQDIPGLSLECQTIDPSLPRLSGSHSLSSNIGSATALTVAARVSTTCTVNTDGALSGDVTPEVILADPGTLLPVSIDLSPNNGGQFFPGQRLRGLMEEVGETHVWTFDGFRDFIFGVTAYPAEGPSPEPALTGNLGARVSVWMDGVELDGENFESTIPGELSVTLPDDGEVEVRFEAQGKLPGWYVASTRLTPPSISGANGEVAFVANPGAPQPPKLFTVPEGKSPYLELSGEFSTPSGSRGIPVTGPAPQDKPLYREASPGTLVYVADQSEQGLLELYRVNLADPGNSVKLNGAEVNDRSVVSRFEIPPSTPSRVVYSVGSNRFGGTAVYLVDLDNPGNPVRLAEPEGDPTYNGQQLNFQLVGNNSVIYQAGSNSAVGSRGHLYRVNLDAPNVATRLSAEVDTAGGEALRDSRSFGAISNDGSLIAYSADVAEGDGKLFLVQASDPGNAVSVDLPSGVIGMTFTPDVSKLLVVRDRFPGAGNGPLLMVDVSDPSTPGTAIELDGFVRGIERVFPGPDSSFALAWSGGTLRHYDFRNPGEIGFEWTFPEVDGALLRQFSFTENGSGFVALVQERNSTDRSQLYLHELGEGQRNQTRLGPIDLVGTTSFGISYFDLSADGEHVYYTLDSAGNDVWQIERTTLLTPEADRRLVVEAIEDTPISNAASSVTRLPEFLILEPGQNP